MSEDRTQPASKHRRQLAREQGQAAHSPELTAAAGWLVAVLVLGLWGGGLCQGTIGLTRRSVSEAPALLVDRTAVVAHVRGLALALFMPLGIIMASFAAGATAAHQLQVRGLWATGLIAPDPARLWIVGRGSGFSAGLERIAWAFLKVIVLVGVSLWSIRGEWAELQRLSEVEFPGMAAALGQAMLQPARTLALCMLILGLADFALRYFRFEAALQTTREEQREDLRMMEGDLALRSKRIRLARAWRGDAPELLAGASLIVGGTGGLAVVLAGGPPPRRLTVRTVAQGNTGLQVRRSTYAARVPQVDSPDLARRLAAHAGASSLSLTPLPAALMEELMAIWPSK
jgi:flagellar biosynthesis protein FlhB